jgi:hypothetical protein
MHATALLIGLVTSLALAARKGSNENTAQTESPACRRQQNAYNEPQDAENDGATSMAKPSETGRVAERKQTTPGDEVNFSFT